MRTRHWMVIACAFAVVMAAVLSRDMGDVVAGDLNGDHRVDILDLQCLVSNILFSTQPQRLAGFSEDGCRNVLDFQRMLAQTQQTGSPVSVPPTKPVCKVCFFSYQGGWTLEPVAEKEESERLNVPLCQSTHVEYPSPVIPPLTTERYLFRLTSNAPPVCA